MKVRNVHSGRFHLPSGQPLAPGEMGDVHDSFRASPLIGPVFEIVEEPVRTMHSTQRRSGRGGK